MPASLRSACAVFTQRCAGDRIKGKFVENDQKFVCTTFVVAALSRFSTGYTLFWEYIVKKSYRNMGDADC